MWFVCLQDNTRMHSYFIDVDLRIVTLIKGSIDCKDDVENIKDNFRYKTPLVPAEQTADMPLQKTHRR